MNRVIKMRILIRLIHGLHYEFKTIFILHFKNVYRSAVFNLANSVISGRVIIVLRQIQVVLTCPSRNSTFLILAFYMDCR